MNPDGAYNGNLRTNTSGTNLNREWLTLSLGKISQKYFMFGIKCLKDVSIWSFDIHGDEALPYIFTAGCADNLSYSDKQKALEKKFEELYPLINPDYQTKYGYEKVTSMLETPTIATSWIEINLTACHSHWKCHFKDNANLPDIEYGWNGEALFLARRKFINDA